MPTTTNRKRPPQKRMVAGKRPFHAIFITFITLLLLAQTAAADTIYVVRPGDTLAAIARRFGTTIQAIAAANHIINPNLIYVNQTLTIPTGSSPAPAPAPAPGPSNPGVAYVVQPGDSLISIALRYGVTVQALAQANGITNINLIFVGQALTIPGSSPPPAPPQPPGPAPAPPTPTPLPAPPPPETGVNLLPNPSFEEGWYNQNGIPELQLPNQWSLAWDEGPNPFDPAPWSNFVRPETRVLSTNFLPPHEHPLYIYDGAYTVKIFKGSGAISVRLTTQVTLALGTYRYQVNVFPDLVSAYDNGQKVWAPDPLSGELRFIVGDGGSGWLLPVFGQKNTFTHTFTINQTQTLRLGVALRGRFALVNNGWFMDDWSLTRVGN